MEKITDVIERQKTEMAAIYESLKFLWINKN